MGADRSMWPGVVAGGRCGECGWKVHDLEDGDLVRLMGGEGPAWAGVLRGASVEVLRWRPAPEVWTGLEYAAHVRGVLEVFGARVALMLREDDPELVVWDDEAAVIEEAYDEQDPAEVLAGIQAAAAAYAEVLRGVVGSAWSRTGRREDTVFTVSSISWYGLHESVHHRHDVERALQNAPT
ncbi:hypothetical protein B7486_61520 [cyanobacterium TDX16]|nr:hypothetical protein B7486_61520 [cyanobacterium TDX16]